MKCGWSSHPKRSAQPQSTRPQWGLREDAGSRRVLSILCHASLLFGSTVVVLAIPLLCWGLSCDPVVKANAKEALNYLLNVLFYGLVSIIGIVLLPIIGMVFLVLLGIASVILPIFAIAHCIQHPDKPFIYPFISHPLT